jgi:hypothetical protein
MEKFPIVEEFKRTVRGIFVGMAHPILVEIPDDRVIEDVDYVYGVSDQKRYLVSEKVQKFNRKAMRRLKKVKIEKADPRVVGTQDTMIIPVGKPGSTKQSPLVARKSVRSHGRMSENMFTGLLFIGAYIGFAYCMLAPFYNDTI